MIITANQTVDNYWFRADVETACGSATNRNGSSIFSYEGAAAGDPTTSSSPRLSNCIDEGPLVPYFANTVPNNTFLSQVKTLPLSTVTSSGVETNQQNIVAWGIDFMAIDVDWEKPTYSYVIDKNTSYPQAINLIEIPQQDIVSNILNDGT